MKHSILVTLSIFLLLVVPAESVPSARAYQVTSCDRCVADQRAYAAIRSSDYRGGRVYVVDRLGGEVHPYRVNVSTESGIYEIRAEPFAGLDAELQPVRQARDAFLALKQTRALEVDGLPFPTAGQMPAAAVEIPGNATARTLLEDAVSGAVSSMPAVQLEPEALGILTSDLLGDREFVVRAVFPDASSYTLQHSGTRIDVVSGEVTYRFALQESTGRDSSGLPIPTQAGDLHPGFSRDGVSESHWSGLLVRLGFRQEDEHAWQRTVGNQCRQCRLTSTESAGNLVCELC